MAFTFLGSASGIAGNASASAYGARLSLDTALSSTSLVGPLPRAAADRIRVSDDASLARIADIPPGGALVQEIAALLVSSRIDLTDGSATASADTAHIGLLRTAAAGGGILPGILPGVLPVPAGPAYNRVDIDAIHGIVSLDCDTLSALRTGPGGVPASEVTLLNAVTRGSRILSVDVPDLSIAGRLFDTLTDNLGNPADDHAAAFHFRLDLATLGVPPPLPALAGRLVEVWLYEVTGNNLRAPSLTNATVGASVDMVHVRVLDRLTLGIEADIRIGHAEASLSNCAAAPPPPPPTNPTITPPPPNIFVNVGKAVEAINGNVVFSQTGLTAGRGQEVEYSLSVFNQSLPATCAITKVVDQLPANTTFVSSAGDFGGGFYNPVDNTVTFDGLAIPGQESRRQGLVLRIDSDAPAGIYVNRFTASGSCGSFLAEAPGISVAGVSTTRVLPRKITTPGTGIADTTMMTLGGLFVAFALGGARLVRRGI